MARAMRAALAALPLLAVAAPLAAHPHIWIHAVATFRFEDGQLNALHLEWTFDEFFGDFVIHEFGVAGEGPVDEATLAVLEGEAFSALEDFDYLTHLRIDGEPVPVGGVRGFEAAVEDGVLIYRFVVELPEPVDPAAREVSASLYDHSFYIDVLLDEHDPVRFEGIPDGACRYRIREDEANAIWFGMVYPLAIDLDCGAP
jgi:ABC-type uncharacterized transport system substrate-binding protein